MLREYRQCSVLLTFECLSDMDAELKQIYRQGLAPPASGLGEPELRELILHYHQDYHISYQLHRRSPTNPRPITSEWTNTAINIPVLPLWRKSLLVSGEVQPPIMDSSSVSSLRLSRPQERLENQVLGGNKSSSARSNAIDFVCHFGLEGIDVKNCILLAGHHVNTASALEEF